MVHTLLYNLALSQWLHIDLGCLKIISVLDQPTLVCSAAHHQGVCVLYSICI